MTSIQRDTSSASAAVNSRLRGTVPGRRYPPISRLPAQRESGELLAGPFARQAVALRLWDDEAKIPDLHEPPLEDYIPQLRTLWR
jgi:hypothetical protein